MTPQQHPNIVDPLAAEYVLGTLRGPARRRFERWRADSPLVQDRCRFWEDHLMHLAKGLRPIRPPAHVWQGIRARLNLPQSAARRQPLRGLAIAASVLLIVGLASLLYWRSTQPGQLSEVATLTASSGAAVWQVEVYSKSGRLIMKAGQLPARQPGRDFELWALPTGGTPVSLGVLPLDGSSQRVLTVAQQQALGNATQIAVTVEQVGGSPTGQPTTTPILVAPLRVAS
jgi:anti-sigma-K factor RskA